MEAYINKFALVVDPTWLWLFKIVLIAVGIIAFYYIWHVISKKLADRAQRKHSFFATVILKAAPKPLHFFVFGMGLAIIVEVAVRTFAPHFNVNSIILAEQLILLFALTWFLLSGISQGQQSFIANEKSRFDKTTVTALAKIAQIFVILIMLLIMLQTMGIRISGLLAFGGIGGAAFALASKDLLSNFFGGFVIYMDKPFVVGDYIRSNDQKIEGVVEHIGWRATCVRTIDKRALYVPNSLFTVMAVENTSRMTHRRIKMLIGLRYDDANKIEAITKDIREFLFQHPKVDAREKVIVNLVNFGASSLDIDLEVLIKETQSMLFQMIQQEIFLKVIDVISVHQAECAFPTMTLDLPKTTATTRSSEDAITGLH